MHDKPNTSESRNVRIAKLLGWRVEQRPITTPGATFDAYRRMGCVEYVLVRPDGTVHEWHDTDDDPDEMTDGFINMPGHLGLIADMWQHAPDFTGSCDASLAALRSRRLKVTLDWDGERAFAEILVPDEQHPEYPRYFRAYAVQHEDDYAEALAAALEAYLLAQEEADGDAT